YLLTERNTDNENLIRINKKNFKQKNNLLKKQDISIIYKKVIVLLKGFESRDRLRALTLTIWYYSNDVEFEDLYNRIKKWALTNNQVIEESLIKEAVERIKNFTAPKIKNLEFDI
ncbi:hypothetical protein SFC34_28350, partial [Priestia aryabhattai]|uniref:hypothetical protein n=1 Tax=Priestia aryabhattai TaxID=412384 RepID=UPI003982014A